MENYEPLLSAFCVYVGRKWPAPDINGTHEPNQSTVYPANPSLLRAHVHSIRWCLAYMCHGQVTSYICLYCHPSHDRNPETMGIRTRSNGLIYPLPKDWVYHSTLDTELAESKIPRSTNPIGTGGGHRWPLQIDRELYWQNATLQRWPLHHTESP